MKNMLILLKGVVSIGIMFFLFNQIDLADTFQLLRNLNLWLAIITLFLMWAQTMIAAERWALILKYQNISLNYKNTLQFLWVGLFFNQVMPSSVGGDVIRGYYLKKEGATLGRATIGVLMDRLFGMAGLVLLVVCTIPLLFQLVGDPVAQWGVVLITCGVFFALIVMFFLDMLPSKFSYLKIVRGLYSLSKEGRECLTSGRTGILTLFYSVVIHFISILAVIIMAEGLGLNVAWGGVVLMVPLVTLFMTVPVSIAGWGVREGVMVVGMGYLGVVPEQALALSVLYGLMLLFVALPGGIVWLVRHN